MFTYLLRPARRLRRCLSGSHPWGIERSGAIAPWWTGCPYRKAKRRGLSLGAGLHSKADDDGSLHCWWKRAAVAAAREREAVDCAFGDCTTWSVGPQRWQLLPCQVRSSQNFQPYDDTKSGSCLEAPSAHGPDMLQSLRASTAEWKLIRPIRIYKSISWLHSQLLGTTRY